MYAEPPRPRLGLAARLSLTALCAVAACASNDNRKVLREVPPAPLVVVVDSEPPAGGSPDELHFAATAVEMQTMLAQELRALDASSRVVTRAELGKDAADIAVTLVPHGKIDFEHAGTANFLGAGGLWLVTWIGGLLVPDSNYTVRMDATCRYARGGAEEDYFERKITGDSVDLSFFERNNLLSMQGLQSLVLPPFWTSDQTDKTSAALTQSSMRLAARQIANELKNNFERLAESEFKCAIRVQTPRNGISVSSSEVPIALTAISQTVEPISKVTASVNGGAASELLLTPSGPSGVEARGLLKGLLPNRANWIRIQVTAAKVYSRTLRLGDQQ